MSEPDPGKCLYTPKEIYERADRAWRSGDDTSDAHDLREVMRDLALIVSEQHEEIIMLHRMMALVP